MGDAGPLGPLFNSTLGPCFRTVYRIGLARKNARFDRGVGMTAFNRSVISVGNLSVGGTGKTPLVEAIVRFLRKNGHNPCIAMRGYKATDGNSDEAEGYRSSLPAVEIVAQPDRTAGLRALLGSQAGQSIDTIVLDDGFQHRQIARDLDIVVVDATKSPFDDQLLPMGWLRESPDAMKRADAVVVTHADQVSADALERLTKGIETTHTRPPLAFTSHRWRGIFSNGTETLVPVDSLEGSRVLLVCAIGNPEAFVQQAKRLGVDVVESILLRDHDPFSAETVDRMATRAAALNVSAVLVTEKDWAKLQSVPREKWPVPVLRPKLGIEILSGVDAFESAVLAAASATTKPPPK